MLNDTYDINKLNEQQKLGIIINQVVNVTEPLSVDKKRVLSEMISKLGFQNKILHYLLVNDVQISKNTEELQNRLEWKGKLTELSLRMGHHLPVISPKADKSNIILFIDNYSDGIGDFEHGISFGHYLSFLKQYGYRICAVVVTHVDLSKAQDDPINKRANYVKQKLESHQHDFDEWYLVEDTSPLTLSGYDQMDLTEWLDLPRNNNVIKVLNEAAIALNISYIFFHKDLIKKYLPSNVSVIKCSQYGGSTQKKFPTNRYEDNTLNHLTNVNMGLPEGDSIAYGIKLHQRTDNVDTRYGRLLDIAKERHNPKFVQHLLACESPNIEDVKKYFDSHLLMPAYLQNIFSSIMYILTQVNAAQSDKACDILLPKNIVNQNVIRAFLTELGYSHQDVAFIDESTLEYQTQAKIRIFSFRINYDDDYNALYQLANGSTGCSGDNSVSLAFSSEKVPFIQYKDGPIGKFYIKQLVPTIIGLMPFVDETLRAQLEELVQYFESMFNLKEFDSVWVHNNDFISEEDQLSEIALRKDQIIACAQRVATLSKKESVQTAWRYFQHVMFEKYNYANNFQDVAKTLLYLQRNKDTSGRVLLESIEIQNLIEEGIIQERDLHQLSIKQLQIIVSCLPIYQGVMEGLIRLKDLINWPSDSLSDDIMNYFEGMQKLNSDSNREGLVNQINNARDLLGFDLIDSRGFKLCFAHPEIIEAISNDVEHAQQILLSYHTELDQCNPQEFENIKLHKQSLINYIQKYIHLYFITKLKESSNEKIFLLLKLGANLNLVSDEDKNKGLIALFSRHDYGAIDIVLSQVTSLPLDSALVENLFSRIYSKLQEFPDSDYQQAAINLITYLKEQGETVQSEFYQKLIVGNLIEWSNRREGPSSALESLAELIKLDQKVLTNGKHVFNTKMMISQLCQSTDKDSFVYGIFSKLKPDLYGNLFQILSGNKLEFSPMVVIMARTLCALPENHPKATVLLQIILNLINFAEENQYRFKTPLVDTLLKNVKPSTVGYLLLSQLSQRGDVSKFIRFYGVRHDAYDNVSKILGRRLDYGEIDGKFYRSVSEMIQPDHYKLTTFNSENIENMRSDRLNKKKT